MRRRAILGATGAALLPAAAAAQPGAGQPILASPVAPEALEPLLAGFLASGGLPALAAAVVKGGQVVAAGATGTRRAGADIPVTRQDRFHIGSDTKAMTATLAAIEVEAGRLTWESTVAQSFPRLSPMDPGLARVTLAQLLSHTSGIAPDDQSFIDLITESFGAGGDDTLNLDEMRAWLIGRFAAKPLAAEPGSRWAYANMNYVIAGAMIERSAGATWEELVATRIFAPLGLATAGFGPQARVGFVDAPMGHALRPDGTPKPILAGPNGDGPAVIGPAGVVHLSILDFAAWAGWNAGEARRGPALVKPETLRLLHTPRAQTPPRPDAAPGTPDGGAGYGMGWGVLRMPFAPEPFVTHTGSNTMNLAMIFLQPARDWAMVLATNIAGRRADATLRELAAALYARFA